MFVSGKQASASDASKFHPSIRCPACRQIGVFQHVVQHDVDVNGRRLGVRRCPNRECLTLIFAIMDGQQVMACYPPERVDFDPSGIPSKVLEGLEEAVACHAAEAYRASAIMVRRTLELLCEDRGAAGPNLAERLKALGAKVVMPGELIEGLQELRLLGNDAAHVESKAYEQIGGPEVELALDVAKEILKACFQYAGLVARLRDLRKKQEA